jgi:hypothetical protein
MWDQDQGGSRWVLIVRVRLLRIRATVQVRSERRGTVQYKRREMLSSRLMLAIRISQCAKPLPWSWGTGVCPLLLPAAPDHSAARRKRGAAPKLPGLLVNIKLPLYIHIFIGIRLLRLMLVLPCSPHPGSPASVTSVTSSASHLSWMIGPRSARIDACFAQKSYQEGK